IPRDCRICCATRTSSARSPPGAGVSETRMVSPMPSCSSTPRAALDATIPLDRKSTRLNSSHLVISYAVFCLKKKKKKKILSLIYHDLCLDWILLFLHLTLEDA